MAAKLIFAVMFSDEKIREKAVIELTERFGEIEFQSGIYDFNFTKYYEKEFGSGLRKFFLSFRKIVDENDLADVKKFTNSLEEKFSENNKRAINIDPGYLNDKSVVMASNKRMSFKEKIAEGIFTHKVLEFSNGEIPCFMHTFKDYLIEENKKFFISVHEKLAGEMAK